MKNSTTPKKALYALVLKGVILLCALVACVTFPSYTALAGYHPTAITFLTQPGNTKVCIGGTATFSVATSSVPLSYRWEVNTDGTGTTWATVSNGSIYSGATGATLTITGATASYNNYFYHCVATDNSGAYTSSYGVLTVGPLGQVINAGYAMCSSGSTILTSGDNNGSYTYKWQVSINNGGSWNDVTNGGFYSGVTAVSLNIAGDPSLNGNLYRTIVTDPTSHCAVTSTGVDTVHVVSSPGVVSPTPASLFICPGTNTNLAVTDSTGVSYQWEVSNDNGSTWSNIFDGGSYTGTLTYALALNAPSTAASYDVVRTVTGYGISCPTRSSAVALTFKTSNAISTQPANKTVCAGIAASFRSVASGSTPAYQWQVSTDNGGTWSSISNGSTYTGTATILLGVTSPTPSMDGYQYHLVATGCGSPVTSSAATLHVNASGLWLGTADTAWGNGGNWCGGVPSSATDVVVPAAAPRMPLISAATLTATAHSLTIQKFAKLSISGGTVAITAPYNIAGTVVYMANGNQNIFPADHGSIKIDSAGNKLLQSNVAITDTLTLVGSAMLVTGSNILTMKAGSQPIGGASFSGSQTGWIVTGNGSSGAANTGVGGLRISQISSSSGAVLFPVGPTPSTYNPLQVTNGGAANDFTVAVNDQYIPGAPAGSVIDRTWFVSAASTGTSNISLGMLWRLADEPSGFNRASASIIRSNGTIIVEETTAGAASGSNPYSFSKGTFSTLTQFTVATSTMVPLTSQLMSFSGEWVNNTSTGLSWRVDANAEFQSYTLQRSEEGTPFMDVSTLNGEPGKTSYTFYDNHPGKDNFYRLKLVSFSGSTTFSQVIELSGAEMTSFANLAPSITDRGVTNLLLSLGKESNIVYLVTDISGRVIARNILHLVKGQHSLPVDISRMPAGIFFVRVTDGQGFNKVMTLIKK